MSVTKAGRLQLYKDFTHYLGMPFVTLASRPQLQASFAHFEQETWSIIPKSSVVNPEIFYLPVGRLQLKSEKCIDACSQHLHKLDLGKMLCDASTAAMNGPPVFGDIPFAGDVKAFGVATTMDLSPLKVDISGIFSPFEDPSQTRGLAAWVIDRTHRLQHFQDIILDSLFKAGFLANAFYNSITIMDIAVPVTWGYKGTYDRKTGYEIHLYVGAGYESTGTVCCIQ